MYFDPSINRKNIVTKTINELEVIQVLYQQ